MTYQPTDEEVECARHAYATAYPTAHVAPLREIVIALVDSGLMVPAREFELAQYVEVVRLTRDFQTMPPRGTMKREAAEPVFRRVSTEGES